MNKIITIFHTISTPPRIPGLIGPHTRAIGHRHAGPNKIQTIFTKVSFLLLMESNSVFGNCVKSNESIVYLHVAQLDNVRLLLIRFIDETGGRKIIFYLQSTLFLIFFAKENDEQ